MKKIFLPITLCFFIGIFGTSCQKNQDDIIHATQDVTFNFSSKAMSDIRTRSAASAEESTLEDITLYALSSDGKIVQTLQIEDPAQPTTLAIESRVTNVYALANVETNNLLSVADLQALTFDASSMPASPFVFSAHSTLYGSSMNIELIRAIAKVEILGKNGFQVNSITVKNTPNKGFITSSQQNVPADAVMVDYSKYSGTAVYVAESNASEPVKFFVEGMLNGQTTAYTFDLKIDGKNINIMRNTCYQIEVSPISDTECEINVVIPEWNDETGDIQHLANFGTYYTVDFHQHTNFTDGTQPLRFVMEKAQSYGIDININSGHGGAFNRNGAVGLTDLEGKTNENSPTWIASGLLASDILGDVNGSGDAQKMWRWQALRDYVFPEVQEFNADGNTTLGILGYEWNPPGHEHCSVGIITEQFSSSNPNVNALAEFEYKFDNSDKDMTGGAAQGWVKSTLSSKEKSLEAARWMQENHRYTSWMVPAHPERANKWHIEDYRNMNDAAPDVFVAFESIPGHQASSKRGGIGNTGSYDLSYTFGGAGKQSATIGGVWDALISEGRRFWLVANSDYHGTVQSGSGDFYPGEYQKTYISMADKSAQSFVDGLRSGNIFTVHGDLIDRLEFSAGSATMGQTFTAKAGEQVRIRILLNDPQGTNFNTYDPSYNNPTLDHVDLIAGSMRERVSKLDPEYSNPNYADVKVIARFDAEGGEVDSNNITSIKWEDLGNGLKLIEYDVTVDKDTYFRLRGTNHGINTAEETDGAGNPLVDNPTATNAEQGIEAFSDLWFYSNPVFVDVK